MVVCKELVEAFNVTKNIGADPQAFYGVLLLVLRDQGRVAISKKLGLRERLVRRILSTVREKPTLLQYLKSFERTVLASERVKCTPVVYRGVSREILAMVKERIIDLRDYIVIYSRNPGKFEVVGVIEDGKLEYPGLPREISEPYISLKTIANTDAGLIVCWKSYTEVVDEALLLSALTSLCVNHMSARQSTH
ncbi:MAG: hypothetical protein QXX93_00565 [Desulfurococcaceae archaeon]